MGASDENSAKSFIAKVADQAVEMVNLDIKTYVGEMTYVKDDDDKKV